MNMSKIACAVAASLLLPATSLNAQERDELSNDNGTSLVERIQVTGSNIKGVDLEGSQPLTIITSEDIKRTGANTLSDLMRTVNQTRGGIGSFDTIQSGATSTSTPAGQAAASLRGIGPSSTLALVNGRRIAASSFAAGTENFVDINSIPASAIERVEILATGASAIYGADAVAGVINYILKDNYEGLQLNGAYRNTLDNDNHSRVNLQALWGKNIAGGNITMFADYFRDEPIRATDFRQTRSPVLSNSYSYLPRDTPNIFFFSARDGNEIGAPNCARDLVLTEFGEEICAYYGNEDDYFRAPFEALSAGLTFTRDVGEVRWKTDVIMSRNKSTSFSSPAPINQVNDEEGPWAPVEVLDIFSPEIRDDLLSRMWIDPFDSFLGRELMGFRYDARFSDPRTIDIETNAYRIVSSFSGSINEWDWETGILLSRSESQQIASAGVYNRYLYTAAVSGELCADSSIARLSPGTNALDCGSSSLLPAYNPFLTGDANNRAILDLTQSLSTRDGESRLYGLDARISGSLMAFGDDYIRMAAGVEVRREKISDLPSIDAQARPENGYLVDVFGFGSSLAAAERTQRGVFAEFYVPLTPQLQLNVAGRYDEYNDFGSTFNPKVGLTYRPVSELVLRGAWSTAFRAPSLTQAGVQLRTTRANFDCSANQKIADLYCEGDGAIRGANVLELGNPALRAEESETYSFGFAYSPTNKTHITVDYWQFDHQNIVDTNMTGVMERALTDASLRHCGLVPEGQQGISYLSSLCQVTDAAGLTIEQQGANLTEILSAWGDVAEARFVELPLFRDHVLLLDNTGSQKLRGIDWRLTHDIQFAAGTLEFGFSGTRYLQYDRNRPGSEQIERLAGRFQFPEIVARADLFWVQDDWYVGAYVYYTDSYMDDTLRLRRREIQELNDRGLLDNNGERQVSSWTTVSLSAGYSFEKADIRLVIDNLFDRDAPTAFGSARGFDAFNSDPFGTQYQLAFSYYFQ